MSYILMVLFAGLIVAADQFTKYLTVHNLSPYACRGMENFSVYFDKLCSSYHIEPSMYDTMTTKTPVVNNVFSFTHIFNDGGAWGMFNGAIWLFVVIFALFAAFMVWEFSKKKMAFTTFERFCMVAIFAGGLGNIIDRIRLGFVIDMIQTDFMNFPIFNVADIFITCGCILLIAHLVLFNKEFWKDDKKK